MMKKFALAVLFAIAAIPVYANGDAYQPHPYPEPPPQHHPSPRPPAQPMPKPTPTIIVTNDSSGFSSAEGGRADSSSNSSSRSASNSKSEANNSLNLKFDAQLRNPVATAAAPALAASTGACMGSSSAGAQGVALGISVGTTWTDEDCDRRYDSIRMQELGFNNAAVQLMCDKPSVREAMRKTGTPCIGDDPYVPVSDSKPTSIGGYTGNDPIVKARMSGK